MFKINFNQARQKLRESDGIMQMDLADLQPFYNIRITITKIKIKY